MKDYLILFFSFCIFNSLFSYQSFGQVTSTQEFQGNSTLTYEECMQEYGQLSQNDVCHLLDFGTTDIGKPLHLFLITSDKVSQDEGFNSDKVTILINNAIHPGEPCGVDASVLFVKTLLENKSFADILDKVNIGIIPMYNIGGGLNRGCCSRANQNGPEFYGFRGNARNLDLNRDFIKCDSENAKSFSKIYQFLNPHVFLDTHTSNGADYQYVMTLITTQPDKATPAIRNYLNTKMVKELYQRMDHVGFPMSPYVHSIGSTPDEGIKDYLETPRFSSGYASLFNALGFISETHMLKSYEQRVQSTYEFIIQLVNYTYENHKEIKEVKKQADDFVREQDVFELSWKLDTNLYDKIMFKGYEAKYKKSDISNNQRLYYDQSAPYEKEIEYYNRYIVTHQVSAPKFYIVPQAWKEVIERLKLNQVQLIEIENDTTIEAEFYFIETVDSPERPYEGHYIHSNVTVSSKTMNQRYMSGDYLIPLNQKKNRYIVETLEPMASDSYFIWNFFDETLQQKEWFSTYVFEDKAAEMLRNDSKLKKEFEQKQQSSEDFRANQWEQLYWLYKRSENYEPTHNRYPIGRIN